MNDWIPHDLCSAVYSERETERVCLALASEGKEPTFALANPDLTGFGEGKSVWLWEAEEKLFGRKLPSWVQHIGTCVGMALGRALQDAIYNALAFGGQRGDNGSIAWEPLYAMSRTEFGRPNWNGEGADPGQACLAAHNIGCIPRGQYGSIDLTKQREDLASRWGTWKVGVPAIIKAASRNYPSAACWRINTIEDVQDAIAAHYSVFRCAKRATGKQRDANGMARQVECGGHAQEWRASLYDFKGRWIAVEQQSWVPGACPAGGGPIKLQDGRELELPEGAAGIYEDDVRYCLERGVVWCVAAPYDLRGFKSEASFGSAV